MKRYVALSVRCDADGEAEFGLIGSFDNAEEARAALGIPQSLFTDGASVKVVDLHSVQTIYSWPAAARVPLDWPMVAREVAGRSFGSIPSMGWLQRMGQEIVLQT